MAYAEITQVPNQTMDDYTTVHAALGDAPADGLIIRIAGESELGLQIVAVWESAAHHDRFVAERLHPAFRRTGHVADPGMRHTEFEVGTMTVAAARVDGSQVMRR